MGGVQSSAHNLGDALWMHERQRLRGQREAGGRYDSQEGQSSETGQDRRKLLKRTRSLAVISEDSSRNERDASTRQFHLGEPNLELPRRPQLIPRAKLIDRNSLKDRLSKSQQHLSESYDRFNDSRSFYSHSTCELYSVPPALTSLPDSPFYGRTSRADPDRLNILDWPRTPRRYRSHQDLDTVSGLVDIVEDNWPIENDRNVDCVYTQVKRKRKEHRSLDSILREERVNNQDDEEDEDDEDELEYFDVLNLLPLSKVRLEFDESDARSSSGSNNFPGSCENLGNARTCSDLGNFSDSNRGSSIGTRRKLINRAINEATTSSEADEDEGLTEGSELSERPSSSRELEIRKTEEDNFSKTSEDDEKCRSEEGNSYPEIVEYHERRSEADSWQSFATFALLGKPREAQVFPSVASETSRGSEGNWLEGKVNISELGDPCSLDSPPGSKDENQCVEKDLLEAGINEGSREAVTIVTTTNLQAEASRKREAVEEAEDYKSIWISDSEEPEDMSRRPQILKVVDNEVTRRNGARMTSGSGEIDGGVKASVSMAKERGVVQAGKYSRSEFRQICPPGVGKDESMGNVETEEIPQHPTSEDKQDVANARNFFERQSVDREQTRNHRNEGRFERIVKETSNILGKACNAVRGSLGFEARSESSDLGLGSDCGSDTRRRSIDDGVDVADEAKVSTNSENLCIAQRSAKNEPEIINGRKSRTNLTRSRSCVDSIECPDNEAPEFDHVRYKIVKSRLFGKNIFANGANNKSDASYDGLMEYLKEYSFQELLLDNNVVIIEPVRAETIERKPSSASGKHRPLGVYKALGNLQKRINDPETVEDKTNENETSSKAVPKQSSLRKHFFYQPIRVNRELIDEELPDPDTVKNVRRMFENSLRSKNLPKDTSDTTAGDRKSVSMKDLRRIADSSLEDVKVFQAANRSRSSSKAKDLTKLFEDLEVKTRSNGQIPSNRKCVSESPKNETKTRILAQSFEARSGNTSPSDSGSTGNKIGRYCHGNQRNDNHRRTRLQNWDAGSVSSGVSSDYPDTDPGSGAPCTSSEDEEIDCRDDEYDTRESDRVSGHFVSQDVLKKIRECGTSVTYYGGKVVNTCNGPLISPMSISKFGKRIERSLLGNDDYVKFRLVKSNSCDSRLELTGRVVERRLRLEARESALREKNSNIRESTIAETPSIEIMTMDGRVETGEAGKNGETINDGMREDEKREPPIVIGLEPKKDDADVTGGFRADFKLGKDVGRSNYVNNRLGSALARWQVNEMANWRKNNADFGKMEFEEFQVLEDSLNGNDN